MHVAKSFHIYNKVNECPHNNIPNVPKYNKLLTAFPKLCDFVVIPMVLNGESKKMTTQKLENSPPPPQLRLSTVHYL